jgi:hypothetical protein
MQLLNRLVDLDEILYGGDNMEGHLNVIFLFRSFNNSKMADAIPVQEEGPKGIPGLKYKESVDSK